MTPEWMKPFCGELGWMARAFVCDGWRYATDGSIVVRVPAPGEPDATGDSPHVPSGMKLAETVRGAIGEHAAPWPSGPYVRCMGRCHACKGRGRVDQTKCPTCAGKGYSFCSHCDHEKDCDDCDGDGYSGGTPCPACGGAFKVVQDTYIVVAGRAIAWTYAELIRALPDAACCAVGDAGDKPLGFRFKGGEGVVMPLHPDRLPKPANEEPAEVSR